VAACAGVTLAPSGDWQAVRDSAPHAAVPQLPRGDALQVEEGLRHAVKPPSLCFAEPQACQIEVERFSLSALRPDERTLDLVQQTLKAQQAAWPLESSLLHCETLCAWRPTAGRACVDALAQGSLTDTATRGRLLNLLDVLGRHGNPLALKWLTHPDRVVRRDVALWLSTRAADSALTASLAEALNNEVDDEAALHLVDALGLLMDPRPVEFLSRLAFRSESPDVRAAAVRALTSLVGRPLMPWLRGVPSENAVVAAAVKQSTNELDARQERPGLWPLELGGAFDFVASREAPLVGGVAFMEEFKRVHERPLQWEVGEKLTTAEMGALLRRLQDGGGFGLEAVRTSLAVSAGPLDLNPLLDVRRSVYAAGWPNRDRMASDMTELLRVVRTHHVLNRPTRYWRAGDPSSGEPLRFFP
jgi:hypothetical protein